MAAVRCTTSSPQNSAYLLSPNPNAQIFVLAFAEAGNNYDNFAGLPPV